MTSPGAHGIDTPSLLSWFSGAGRPLPWREDGVSAWEILLCEVMSQQTPVARVIGPWTEWMQRWPTPDDLAEEEPGTAVAAWGRLGYPRRALRLHACAVAIAVDATVVRLILVPALMAMFDEWNWWLPTRRKRATT